jgi:predicted dehydrogenase
VLSTADIGLKKVIPAMQKASRAEVVAIGSRDGKRAEAAAAQLGIPRTHGTYEALLADPDVDAVYIPLPNHLHAEWAIAAAAAGKHVLCEKPLALTVADAQQMIDAADRAGVRLMEAFMYRLHPSWVKARDLIASGRIGTLNAVQSWFSYYNDDQGNIRNILSSGGGALYDIGCYCINLSRTLFGGEPTRVQGAIVRDHVGGTDVLAAGILEFPAGIATFTCSTRLEDDQRVHIYGTRGHITIPIPFNIPPDRPTRIQLAAGGDPPVAPAIETFTFETADPYTVETDAFAAAILDGTPLPFPTVESLGNLRVIEQLLATGPAAPTHGAAR